MKEAEEYAAREGRYICKDCDLSRVNLKEAWNNGYENGVTVGREAGYREALEWVLNNACGTTWDDDWATMIARVEEKLKEK